MRIPIRAVLAATLIGSLSLPGCSQSDPASAGADSSQGAAGQAPDAGPSMSVSTKAANDPCDLITDAEVRNAFAQAAAGERDRALDKNGILTCLWDTPTDRFVVQMYSVSSGSAEDELRGRMAGSIDPMMPGAAEHVRYETLAGAGDEAMLVVEKADPQRGILTDTAMLVTRRGERIAVLFTGSSLAGGDRASALRTLETLGRSVAKRLQP